MSLSLSEERKFLEVIRDRQGGGGQLHRTFTAVKQDDTACVHLVISNTYTVEHAIKRSIRTLYLVATQYA